MQHIRIPTPNAPAGHHLAFICAVAELAHRIIERKTGLNVRLTVAVHELGPNRARIADLRSAAEAAQMEAHKVNQDVWHTWQSQGTWNCADVVVYSTDPTPAARLCEYDDCDQLALPGGDWCAEHKAEHDQLMAEELEPETTTELAQAVTAQLESAALAAQYTAANDARREG